ncbi:RNA polymerase II transcription mediator complex subunit 9-domain-containing protein [Lasiosphaeria hispida]|uniref:Mediator of RNA polymerase II transcription subunit 9 n=1 Tax=Lasiosphaeria hispida TaxID=260671 RepID=A0AAJ0MBE5_9PEZI|nr:RNA polymerase II transcription mediator complex subunit 9-domain-containing protein [Lasiosphaeria hispida]
MTTHLPNNLSPDAIDTLTELTSILDKLRSAQATTNTATLNLPGVPANRPADTTPAPGAVTGTTPLPSGAPANGASLSVKELPAATDNLKHKLQRARAAIKTLPDVTRTLAQQQGEIEELEERRRRQLVMLAKIKGAGLQFSLAEQSKGDEGDRMVE